jgi:hypothetical protein
MLAAAVLAVAGGVTTVAGLFRFVQDLNSAQRRALRFRSSPKNRDLVPPPGESCWRDVLKRLDPVELARAVVQWQLRQTKLPPLLAIDGKTLHHGLATLVTLCDAQTGEPLVQLAQAGPGHEKTLAHTLIESLPPGTLDSCIVSGDALYADPALVRPLVQDQGAVTIMQLKDNQPTAVAGAQAALAQGTPLFSRPHPRPAMAVSTNGTCAPPA